jgi:hypothetical protein
LKTQLSTYFTTFRCLIGLKTLEGKRFIIASYSVLVCTTVYLRFFKYKSEVQSKHSRCAKVAEDTLVSNVLPSNRDLEIRISSNRVIQISPSGHIIEFKRKNLRTCQTNTSEVELRCPSDAISSDRGRECEVGCPVGSDPKAILQTCFAMTQRRCGERCGEAPHPSAWMAFVRCPHHQSR